MTDPARRADADDAARTPPVRHPAVRRRGEVRGRKVICPARHEIQGVRILLLDSAHGFVGCVQRIQEHGVCGVWLYLSPDGAGGHDAIEVDVTEVCDIQRRGLATPAAVREYLRGHGGGR